MALYCPEYGYYESEKDRVGRRGDFYTSVSVGPFFGELLARQFASWAIERPGTKMRIVEAGAHDGQLANDILSWFKQEQGGVSSRLTYTIVEPSDRRRSWQRTKLQQFQSTVGWVSSVEEIGTGVSETTIIFSNELLDAFPVHRFRWNKKRQSWIELGVGLEMGELHWREISEASASPALPSLSSELQAVLPDGFVLDVCPAAEMWWREAAQRLSCGWLVTLDYGFGEDEILRPERQKGTLRAYYRHQLSADLLAHVGEQDLTAHINFDALERAGENAGLVTKFHGSQSTFLTQIFSGESPSLNLTASEIRQFKTLTHPEHLGRAFRVLVQQRAKKE